MKESILLIGHGSPIKDANNLEDVARSLHALLHAGCTEDCVQVAYLQFAEPTIRDTIRRAVEEGAKRIIIHPLFLSSGRHVTENIPAMIEEARGFFPDVKFIYTEPLGMDDKLAHIVMERIKAAEGPNPGGIPRRQRSAMQKGFIQVYTGNGKGKTTAALGLAIRAAGGGLKVFMGQFIKEQKCCEHDLLDELSDRITVRRYGGGFIMGRTPSPADLKAARAGYEEIKKILRSNEYDVVILDEANVAVHCGLITVQDLLDLMALKPAGVELVITGRNADEKVMEAADLVTEMREIKHYHAQGVNARRGIEK